MGRNGYSDDCENVQLWRAAVDRAMFGARGQQFLRKLRDALDAMSVKRLITEDIVNEDGEVCALGAVDPTVKLDPYDGEAVAAHFNIAPALAAEVAFVNDGDFSWNKESPEQRWQRMRQWVDKQIGPDDEAQDVTK
jgi:hypothetical protein